ncbi:D-xylose-proton symporter-like 2 isoform X2 [Cucumis melo var. makuwa]|uniref:D-xylose-proton symporter-like 2 isoform X2 n=1 Tax=Cucumis melo var. makuwa TaxID=1194695 RepID=A0A5D3DY27_CUCMM|nr:D-xylose-proton symporter-like 2 isoform X2 [Cucumis melo var. makuwa]
MSEESNCILEFIETTSSTVFDLDPHFIVLPTNQVSWNTDYRGNLLKEIESLTSQRTLVQDSEFTQDQEMENSIDPCIDNKMSENDRFDVALPENMEENNSGEIDLYTSWMLKMLSEWRPSGCVYMSLRLDLKSSLVIKAMSLGIFEEICLQKVLFDLHQECETPIKLFCANKATISIANNPTQHDTTKHVADVLTKGLRRGNFDFGVIKLDFIDIYVPTGGSVRVSGLDLLGDLP